MVKSFWFEFEFALDWDDVLDNVKAYLITIGKSVINIIKLKEVIGLCIGFFAAIEPYYDQNKRPQEADWCVSFWSALKDLWTNDLANIITPVVTVVGAIFGGASIMRDLWINADITWDTYMRPNPDGTFSFDTTGRSRVWMIALPLVLFVILLIIAAIIGIVTGASLSKGSGGGGVSGAASSVMMDMLPMILMLSMLMPLMNSFTGVSDE
jgi:hypothetical protein